MKSGCKLGDKSAGIQEELQMGRKEVGALGRGSHVLCYCHWNGPCLVGWVPQPRKGDYLSNVTRCRQVYGGSVVSCYFGVLSDRQALKRLGWPVLWGTRGAVLTAIPLFFMLPVLGQEKAPGCRESNQGLGMRVVRAVASTLAINLISLCFNTVSFSKRKTPGRESRGSCQADVVYTAHKPLLNAVLILTNAWSEPVKSPHIC